MKIIVYSSEIGASTANNFELLNSTLLSSTSGHGSAANDMWIACRAPIEANRHALEKLGDSKYNRFGVSIKKQNFYTVIIDYGIWGAVKGTFTRSNDGEVRTRKIVSLAFINFLLGIGLPRAGRSQERPHFAVRNRLAVKSTESLIKLAIIYAQRRSFPGAKERENAAPFYLRLNFRIVISRGIYWD